MVERGRGKSFYGMGVFRFEFRFNQCWGQLSSDEFLTATCGGGETPTIVAITAQWRGNITITEATARPRVASLFQQNGDYGKYTYQLESSTKVGYAEEGRTMRLLIHPSFLITLLFFWAAPLVLAQATLTVNSTGDGADSNTANGICDDGAGNCTLRAAIEEANASYGSDLIAFNIPGTGPHTIQPLLKLPSITDPVTIDGYTQSGASPNTNPVGLGLNTVLMIEIDGSLLGGLAPSALTIIIDNTTVRGLVINRFATFGIDMDQFGFPGPSPKIGNNIVEGNFIGTDVTGTMALGNNIGVAVETGNNRIGGVPAAARNLISGNGIGIVIAGPDTNGNVVQGNLIGTDVTGTVALGNIATGVSLGGGTGTNNLVGGTAPEARNVISGNDAGVTLGVADGNRVQGNFIGTDITGTVALGNRHGVSISASDNNTIGGTEPGAGNVISGSTSFGVVLGQGSTGNRVEGNFIGTDETGSIDLGNGADGVRISSPNNTIGGMVPGAGNILAYNSGPGVAVISEAATGNAILSNAIFANSHDSFPNLALGIDLADVGPGNSLDGVTPNDPGDGDTGANTKQNFPELTFAGATASTSEVDGTLNSTPNATFRLEFFANTTCDPSGFGEGETFLGAAGVTTDASGDVSFSAILPTAAPVGHVITMTATDANGNTSEFSDCSIAAAEVFDITPPTPPELLQALIAAVQTILDANPNTPLADKLEDALAKLQTALAELENKTPPDNQAAVGNIEGAVGDIQAAVDEGLLDPDTGAQLMDELAGIARLLASTALDEATAQGGDPVVLDAAQLDLDDGDALRASGAFKDAVSEYKDALAKAESQLL